MARKSKSLLDYQKIAAANNLEFVGAAAPHRTTESVAWKCLTCGREIHRAYSNFKQTKNACNCRWQTLKPSDYENLGERLGITWLGKFPPNINTETSWRTAAGMAFWATYKSLAYRKIPKKVKELIDENRESLIS